MEEEGRKDQPKIYDNITGKPCPGHKCQYEGRWKNYFDFKEKVIDFMGRKEEINGNLKTEDQKLDDRLKSIENKVWAILLLLAGVILKVVFGT
ncbi:MAG: hypothetical protein ACC614_02170 [Methanobacterium formicicum]|uniref:hypothetical protein n=1 Tax=Methanobacterium formicicum TaxID=2162 RepID=UPI0035305E78